MNVSNICTSNIFSNVDMYLGSKYNENREIDVFLCWYTFLIFE